ncbi:hypothetical protein DJ568_14490 [Mucilaginibacter hurinus]|uniref:Sialate O-acetylesterase domain-containing protein n=1 Tax=Mucilaginibacter hurinus TaxID=2201324 RepID=A0A367GM41_9SPHI|nr:sialate O-acetylesterase [Mucilaginibacter hurinus]RCH54088.1 hypothetical protein DJ568_14490 [Mucilaginibacter hurinus]
MKISFYTICIVFLSTFNSAYAQTLKLANILQSNMVVQQAKPFKLWGTAAAGETIQIRADWMQTSVTATTAANGKWEGMIQVPAAKTGDFTAHTITIQSNTTTLTLKNILIGEVWLCAGQSNMDMPVDNQSFLGYPGVTNYQQEIAAANFPSLRYYESTASFRTTPADNTSGTWSICTPANVKNYSAVAYFFGRALHLKLNIPIGLVVSAAPGASCQAFMSKSVLDAVPVFRTKFVDQYRTYISSQEEVDKETFFSNVTKPTLLYNGVIHPLLNLSIKGFNWYQGESNVGDGSLYTRLCTEMIKSWRRDFKQGNLPFNFVQIASNGSATQTRIARFREAQEDLLKLDGTGMAVAMDVGEVDNIHPSNKRPVGERLAFNALFSTYGKNEVAYQGPTYLSHTISDDTVKVTFTPESMGTGLMTNDGQPPKHFLIAGADMIFQPARAQIVGRQIWALSDKVKKPVAIRYAFNDGTITNLFNKAGLPAAPFRTDRFNYTACSFAYAQFTAYSGNCANCSIKGAISSTDNDTLSASIFKVHNVAGAYAEQHLYFQHPGVKDDAIRVGIRTSTPLNTPELLNKIELFIFSGATLTQQLSLNDPRVKLIALADNRYAAILTSAGKYDRIAVRLNSGSTEITTMELSYAVQQFAIPEFITTTACINTTAKITITQAGEYNWYEQPTGGLPIFTGRIFTTPKLTASKTYYVQDVRNSCETGQRTAITVNTEQPPAKPVSIVNNGDKVTAGNKARVRINNPQPGYTYKWYYTQLSATPFFTGEQFDTPALTADTAVYVEAISGNCISERARIVIDVKEPADDVKLSIYPNPTQGEINFLFKSNYSKPFKATVISMQGKTLYTATATANNHLNAYKLWIGQLPDGIYILNVKGEDFTRALKIVISR